MQTKESVEFVNQFHQFQINELQRKILYHINEIVHYLNRFSNFYIYTLIYSCDFIF